MKTYIKPSIEISFTENESILNLSDIKEDNWNPNLPPKAKENVIIEEKGETYGNLW